MDGCVQLADMKSLKFRSHISAFVGRQGILHLSLGKSPTAVARSVGARDQVAIATTHALYCAILDHVLHVLPMWKCHVSVRGPRRQSGAAQWRTSSVKRCVARSFYVASITVRGSATRETVSPAMSTYRKVSVLYLTVLYCTRQGHVWVAVRG